jgi:hypothetical protein
LFCLFFVVHLVQVVLAGWGNFRGMITGFEVKKIPPPVEEDPENEEATLRANAEPLKF